MTRSGRRAYRRAIVGCAFGLACTYCTGGDPPGIDPRARGVGGGGGDKARSAADAGVAGHAVGAGNAAGAGGGSAGRGGTSDAGLQTTGLPVPNIAAIFKTGCATSSVESQLVPSNLLFVIDRSASMKCNPPPTTDSPTCEEHPDAVDPLHPTKWMITRDALSAAIDALPGETIVGLSYFSNDDACGVYSIPSVPLAELDAAQRSTVRTSLNNVEPGGATPLVGATILAYQHLHSLALSGAIHGRKFVVLLTDGQQSDNCSDPTQCTDEQTCTDLVDQEAKTAAGPGVGIETFVIGAPGSETAREELSRIAFNGGTGLPGCDVAKGNCHFDMTQGQTFDQALADALTKIAGHALTCELPVPRPTGVDVDKKFLNVIFSPADGSAASLIFKLDDKAACDASADGWQYGTDDSKIELCGKACDRVRKKQGARVDVVLGCPVRGPE